MAKTPVMFVHGMWLHSTSWQPWADRFQAAGYDPVMPESPGVADTVAATRDNPDAQAGNGLDETENTWRSSRRRWTPNRS